jgi:putative membrane protein
MSSERRPLEPDAGGSDQRPPDPDAGRADVPPRRLHPAGIAVLAVGALRDAALPLLAVLLVAVAGGGLDTGALTRALTLAGAAAAFSAVVGVVTWMTTTWQIGSSTIRHRRGFLSVKETDVPLARVQALDTVRGPIQRLFGVLGVHVQTAGGGKEGEIVLPALRAADVEALRAAVGPRRSAAQPVPATAAGRRLGWRRLVVAALTAGQLGVLLPVLAAAPQLLDDVFGGDLEDAGRAGAGIAPDTFVEWALLAAGVLAVGWVLSVAGTVVTFAGFAVTRQGDHLRIHRGLLARRDASVPAPRVQAVRVVEGILRRPWGLATLRVEVAGYKAEAAAAQTLFPLLRRSEVRGFLEELLPELADDPDGLEPVPPRAARR